MVCVYCSGQTEVINSRLKRRYNATWRRRKCHTCHSVITTHEIIDLSTALVVMSPDRPLEPFLREKLLISIYSSLKHRKTAVEDAASLTATVIANVMSEVKDAQVSTHEIAVKVGMVLKRFDKVAATHYIAFHPSYSTIG